MNLLQRLRRPAPANDRRQASCALRTAPTPSESDAQAVPALPAVLDEDIPRYPPFLKGLPLPPMERLVATQSELITRLRRELALGEDDDGSDRWEAYIAPVIERYAAFVHLIPASEAHHHRGAGGLYRHGLEAAFHAARASRGVMVGLDRPRVEQRRLEPRLRAAAALGGLLHDAGKALYDVAATDREGSSSWSPIDEDLGDWAARLGIARYFLHWREQRHHGGHESFNVIALKRILPSRVERWLSQPDPGLYSGFVAAVTGVPHSSVLVELVRQADRHSVERDLREHRIAPIDTAVGVPVDRYLLDAMRRLLHDGRWQVNVPGARVWLLREGGLHLVWPAAAQDVTELLAAERVPGIPRDPDSIAELLLERDLAVARADAVGRHATWRLAPAVLAREVAKPVVLSMLRLRTPELLFPYGAPAAVEVVGPAVAHGERGAGSGERSEPIPPGTARPTYEEPAGQRKSDASGIGESASDPSVRSERVSVGLPDTHGDPAVSPATETDRSRGRPSNPTGTDLSQSEGPEPVADETPAHPAALTEAIAWLKGQSESSARLLGLLVDTTAPAPSDRQLAWRDGLLWLRYPAWFTAMGWQPAAAAEALSGDGLLEPDPRTPMRRVREQAGQRWLVLNAEVSARVRLLLGGAPETPDDLAARPGQEVSVPRAEPRAPSRTRQATAPPVAALCAVPDSGIAQPSAAQPNSAEPTAAQADPPSLVSAVLADLTAEHGPGDGSQMLTLGHTELKRLAKRHGLGVYSLRTRLLSDPRFRLGAHQRIEVTR
jgi:conjugal transfer pilus assembly protein TraI